MFDFRRTPNAAAVPVSAVVPPARADPPAIPPKIRVPRPPQLAGWIGGLTAVFTFVLLGVFMLQNTHSVEVTFFWMQGSLPLALALLIAGIVVGAARIARPRRLIRRVG